MLKDFSGAPSGAFLGALLVSILVVIADAVLHPKVFGDGQYVLVFFFTIPLGGLLGGTLGFANTNVTKNPHLSGSLCIGAGTTVIAFLLFWITGSSSEKATLKDLALTTWVSVPIVFAIATTLWGLHLFRK